MRFIYAGYGSLLFVVLVLLLISHSTSAQEPTQQINWTVETVQHGIDISEGRPSIAVDEDGGVHICFHDTNASALMYAFRSIIGEWHIEVIDNDSRVGKHNSIAIDSDGIVHIVYLDYEFQDLKYAWKGLEGTWTTATIDSKNMTGKYPTIRIDSLDGLHVVYYSKWEQSIKYANRPKGQDWFFQTAYSESGFGCIGMDLQIGLDDTLHLAYVRDLGNLFYASKPVNEPWDFENIVIENDARGHISLAVDMNATLEIVFTLHHGGAVRANKNGENDWYTDKYVMKEKLSKDVSNGITSRGQHYICGWQYPPGGFVCYYETKIGSVRMGLVDPNVQGEVYTTLIIDGNDQVHIVYADIGNNRLMYATDRYRPPPPENVRVIVGDTFVSLEWDPPKGWESIPNLSYNIYRRGPLTYMVPPLFKSGIIDTILFDENVRRKFTYVYRLASVSDAGEGHLSGPFEAIPTRYPTIPVDVKVIPGDEHAIITWSPPKDNQSHIITGYRIYWQNEYIYWHRFSSNRGGEWNNITLEGTQLSFVHTGLINGYTIFTRSVPSMMAWKVNARTSLGRCHSDLHLSHSI
jgi:hypothetical protein